MDCAEGRSAVSTRGELAEWVVSELDPAPWPAILCSQRQQGLPGRIKNATATPQAQCLPFKPDIPISPAHCRPPRSLGMDNGNNCADDPRSPGAGRQRHNGNAPWRPQHGLPLLRQNCVNRHGCRPPKAKPNCNARRVCNTPEQRTL